MTVITISRGTFSGGKMLAECLSQTLGYRCIDRDVILARAAMQSVSEQRLREALETPPWQFRAVANHRKYIYLALIQAALAEEVRTGKAVYHGLAGHLLLQGGIAVLRLRIIAPLEFRIRMAQDRLNLSRSEAVGHIEKVDKERQQWTRYLYGVDWEDPSLYDLIINLEYLSIKQACRLVAGMVSETGLDLSPEHEERMEDFVLGSRVRAALASSPFTSHLEVEVEARHGSVCIKGSLYEQVEAVRSVALAVPGVTGLTIEEPAATTA
jgi:cytidylate kinase